MSDQKPILIIDGLNLFARSYVVVPVMSSQGHHVGGSVGFIRSLNMLVRKFNPKKVYVCWEGGGSARRRQILPEYKMNRKPLKLNRSKIYEDIPNTKENFNHQVALVTKLIQYIPINQLYVPECEADDIIGYIARYCFKEDEIVIVSMDQDFHQLLSPRIRQWSPSLKKLVNDTYVFEKYGITVENFVTARCFIGDSSDNISGIKGIGFKTLAKRFPELKSNDFVSVNDIIKLCEQRSKNSNLKMYKMYLK